MQTITFFLERYRGLQEYPPHLVDGASDSQLRHSINGVNSIAWLLWHMARCEDLGVNRLVTDGTQVLEENSWPSLQTVLHMGTGMTADEVDRWAGEMDLTELMEYREAVSRRTLETAGRLETADLDGTLTAEYLHRVMIEQEAGGSMAHQIVEAYLGQTKGWALGHLALTHNFYHMGQGFMVRTMLGLPDPW